MRTVPSPSRMLAEATGMDPVGTPSNETCTCRLCGGTIEQGDLRFEQKFGASFNDGAATLDRVGNWICGWCGPFLEAGQMTQMQGVLVHQPEGEPGQAWRVTRNSHIRWAYDQRFEGPVVLAKATRKREHLIWQAPVSLSPDLIQFRLGRDNLVVRRDLVEQFRNAVNDDLLKDLFPKTPAGKRFFRLGQQMAENAVNGFPKARAWYDALPEDLRTPFENMGPGDLWFVQYVLTQTPEEPARFKFDTRNA
ncbi:type IV CRISPR-associated protein Csf1 [Thioalkalivibrio sp. ALE19]|uniref:type IV CRISPR-associated protein Csf1 n=1 Tax=Thioalkalivibrio sp. ALE19 TaxID=1266909 RepID=UPI001E43FA71|nr:type IV CRISPR-associated protein Csf1 [Thioalkalivibrio sp. ALE19]